MNTIHLYLDARTTVKGMPVSEAEPRWRRAPDQRPGELLDAALMCFEERGYDESSVQEIAARSGVSVGTVYRYFDSKQHLLEAIHHRFHDGLAAAFDTAAARLAGRVDAGEELTATLALGALIDATTEFLVDQRIACRVIATYVPRVHDPDQRESHDRAFVESLAAVLQVGVDRGVVATTDPTLTAHLLHHAMRGTLTASVAFGEPADLDGVVAQAKELFGRALAVS